jgi:hypothetical protein
MVGKINGCSVDLEMICEKKDQKAEEYPTPVDLLNNFIKMQVPSIRSYFHQIEEQRYFGLYRALTGREEQEDPAILIEIEKGSLLLALMEMGEKFLKTDDLDFLEIPRTAFIKSALKLGRAYLNDRKGFESAFQTHYLASLDERELTTMMLCSRDWTSDTSPYVEALAAWYANMKEVEEHIINITKGPRLDWPTTEKRKSYDDGEAEAVWSTIFSKYEEDNKENEWQLDVLKCGDYKHSKFSDHLVDLYFSGQEPQDLKEREKRKSRWSTTICGSAHKHTKYPDYDRFTEEEILEEIIGLEILGHNQSKSYEQDARAMAVWREVLTEYEEDGENETRFKSLEAEYFNYSEVIDQLADLCFSSHQLQEAEETKKVQLSSWHLAFLYGLGKPSKRRIEDYDFSEEEILEEIKLLEILSRGVSASSGENVCEWPDSRSLHPDKKSVCEQTSPARKPSEFRAFDYTFLLLTSAMIDICSGKVSEAVQKIKNRLYCPGYDETDDAFKSTLLDALSIIEPNIQEDAAEIWQRLRKRLFEEKKELPSLEVICGDTSRRAVNRLAGNKIKEGLVIVRTYYTTDIEQGAVAWRDIRKSRFAQEGLDSYGLAPVEVEVIERDNLIVHAEKVVPAITLNVLGDTGLIPLTVAENVIRAIHTYQTELTKLFNSKRDDAEIRYAIDYYDIQHYVKEFNKKFIQRLHTLSQNMKLSFDPFALREAIAKVIWPLETEPDVVIHGDVRGQNILVKPDDDICFIDFEKMAVGKRIFDYLNFVEHLRVESKNPPPIGKGAYFQPYEIVFELFNAEESHTKKERTSLQKELDFLQKLSGSFIPSSDSKDYRHFFFNELLPIAAVLQIGHQIGSVIKYHQTAEKWYKVGRQRVLRYLENCREYLMPRESEDGAIGEISEQFSSLHRQIEQGIFRTT